MRDQIQEVQRHQSIAQELEQQRQVLPLFGAISQAAAQTDGRLRVVNCHVVDLQTTDVGENRSGEASAAGTVTLVGMSLDSPTVAEFHEELLQSGLFTDVKLIKSNERRGTDTVLYDYEVRCEL